MDAPALMPPNFNKDYILYTFTTNFSYDAVLTQKHAEDTEIPISFMISTFKGDKINYTQIDKKYYTVQKYVKHVRPYLLKSKTKVIIPYTTIRNVLVQKDLGEKRAHWMIVLQEYDLEINLANIVKGQGLCFIGAQCNNQEHEQ